MKFVKSLLGTLLSCSAAVFGQTTQGLISGRVLNLQTGRPVTSAIIGYFNVGTGSIGSTHTDDRGSYYLTQLSPGLYRISVTVAGFQSQEVNELELRVAGR